MRATRALASFISLLASTAAHHSSPPAVERIAVNDNRSPAGTLHGGVLTIRLEAREGEWHPDGDAAPGIVVRAFAEQGKPLSVPGPLIRVPEGTEIHAFVSNALPQALVIRSGNVLLSR